MIVSANIENKAKKIYNQINKLRSKGWFSKDITNMLIEKYGSDKQCMLNELAELDKQEKEVWKRKQELAKKINKLK